MIIRKIVVCLLILSLILIATGNLIAQDKSKSPGTAFFLSLLLPGLGESYAGSLSSAKYLIASEIALIGTAVAHEVYSTSIEKDYKAYAAKHAGVDITDKQKNYYVQIAKYPTIYIYNEKMRKDRDFQNVISETPDNIWMWDSDQSRFKFFDLRTDADKIKNRATFFYSGLFLNHVISGINAALRVKRDNKEEVTKNTDFNFKMKFNPLNPKKFLSAKINF